MFAQQNDSYFKTNGLRESRTFAAGCVDSAGFGQKLDRIVLALETKF
jgi:hypothetical protein